jgi:hypothetical protein
MGENEYQQFWIKFEFGGGLPTHQISDISMNPIGKESIHVIEYAALAAARAEIESLKSLMSVQLDMHDKLKAADKEIEMLNRAYYLLRCEVQSYINEKETAIFNEIQATENAENLKREMIQVKHLYNLKCEGIEKLRKVLAIQTEALDFYSDDINWNETEPGFSDRIDSTDYNKIQRTPIGYYGGVRARQALQQTKEIMGAK